MFCAQNSMSQDMVACIAVEALAILDNFHSKGRASRRLRCVGALC
jgi:hypothetical protein